MRALTRSSLARPWAGRQEGLALPITAVVVGCLVLGPLAVLVRTSLVPGRALPFSTAALTAENYGAILADPATWRLLGNTLVYAGGSVFEGLVIAFAVGWLSERWDMPRRFIRTAMFVYMALPPLALTFGWILLLNRSNGVLNVAARNVFGLSQPLFDIYSMQMLIVISGLMLAPTMYVMLAGVLRNMDPQLEGAGAAAGSRPVASMRHITLPLLTPGLLSVAIYGFMLMVQVFDTPLVIGLTAGVPVLSTRIYALTSAEGALPRYGVGAAFGTLLLVLAVLLMLGYFRATRIGERFRVIGSRGFRAPRRQLGHWRPLALLLVYGYFAVMLLPILILLWTSLRPFYDVPSLAGLRTLSLANYSSIAHLRIVGQAAGNTVLLVLAAPTCTMLLASLVSWFAVRNRSFLARLLDVLAFTPMAIPGIVMAMAVLLIYIRTPLYGTIWIIVLAETVIGLAFGTRTMNSALLQVHKDLESAASASGATWMGMLRTVLLPLLLPQILSGWLWCAGYALRDLTVPLLLRAEDNVVVSSALLQLWNTPSLTGASALAVLMILALMVLVVPVQVYAIRKGV